MPLILHQVFQVFEGQLVAILELAVLLAIFLYSIVGEMHIEIEYGDLVSRVFMR